MKNINLFKVKQRVEIHISTESGILNLSTHIEKITKDGEFIVAAPFYKGKLYPFLSREHLDMLAIIEGIGVVSCEVVVGKRLRNGNIILLLLEKISDIKKTQRRKHYRLPTLLETEIEVPKRPEMFILNGVSRDISAGGMRCITHQKLFEDESVELKVKLNGEVLKVNSSVLDSVPVKHDNIKFETRFEFLEMNYQQERIVVAYIFEEQRKRGKR